MLERFKPRFSLRFLLAVMTAAAVLCYFLWPMTDGITEAQARSIQFGMLPNEVAQICDVHATSYTVEGQISRWYYAVAAPMGGERRELVIEFGYPSGRVTKIERHSLAGFAFPW